MNRCLSTYICLIFAFSGQFVHSEDNVRPRAIKDREGHLRALKRGERVKLKPPPSIPTKPMGGTPSTDAARLIDGEEQQYDESEIVRLVRQDILKSEHGYIELAELLSALEHYNPSWALWVIKRHFLVIGYRVYFPVLKLQDRNKFIGARLSNSHKIDQNSQYLIRFPKIMDILVVRMRIMRDIRGSA